MATKRAKTLDTKQVGKLLAYIDDNSTMPERDRLIVLLSFGAGLRVGEIAKIDLSAMTDVEGKIASHISVYSNVGKQRRERSIPISPDIRKALIVFMATYPNAPCVAISSQPLRWAARNGNMPDSFPCKRMSPNTLQQYYGRLLRAVGFVGASSHSGRRTFATEGGRKLATHNCSVKDLQLLLGHASLKNTEAYLEPSTGASALVASTRYT